jgi:hypothetical protein
MDGFVAVLALAVLLLGALVVAFLAFYWPELKSLSLGGWLLLLVIWNLVPGVGLLISWMILQAARRQRLAHEDHGDAPAARLNAGTAPQEPARPSTCP